MTDTENTPPENQAPIDPEAQDAANASHDADSTGAPMTDAEVAQAREDAQAAEQANGFHGPIDTSTEGRPLPVDQSAPADVDTDPAAGVVNPDGIRLATASKTMAEQTAPRLKGADYRQGYAGTLPDADNRPDLTLAGVLGLNDTED